VAMSLGGGGSDCRGSTLLQGSESGGGMSYPGFWDDLAFGWQPDPTGARPGGGGRGPVDSAQISQLSMLRRWLLLAPRAPGMKK